MALAVGVRGNNDSHVFGEVLGQPETNIGLLAGVLVLEVLETLNQDDDLAVVNHTLAKWLEGLSYSAFPLQRSSQ